jgi:L-asparaginase
MSKSQNLPLVYVIGTGGSISCIGESRTDFINYSYGGRHYSIQEMLSRVPEAGDLARVKAEQFSNVAGGDLPPAHWPELARRVNAIFRDDQDATGVAVTHGTATLEETAYFLNLTVKSSKPVVVTGAMRPMTAISTDADLNLLDCIRVAASPTAAGRGVLVVLNNQIQAAREVTKSSTSRVDTFKSGDLGFLGYADSDGEVVFYRAPAKAHTNATEFDVEAIDNLPRVDIALAYAGADGTAVKALADAGCDGLVAAGIGSGGAPRAFLDALSETARAGVPVVVASQAGTGRTMARRGLIERGLIVADNLLPRKARVLLMLALGRTRDRSDIQRMMLMY